jgi:hypothetical protein
MKRFIISVVGVCIAFASVCMPASASDTFIPSGIEVVGYENTNYMDRMIRCAEDGSKYAVMIGSVYEAQRNLKIKTESLQYKPTYFFDTYDAKMIRNRLSEYQNDQKETSSPELTTPQLSVYYTEQEVIMVAKVLYRECRGIPSVTEQACVAWTICNRADTYGKSIAAVIQQPNQFAYQSNTPVTEELYWLAKDVLQRWNNEKNGQKDVGRVLPKDYLWFTGDGTHNHFRNAYRGGSRWNYSLNSPYQN